MPRRFRPILCLFAMLIMSPAALAREPFDEEPVRYSDTPADDPVSRLQKRIDSGELSLERDDAHGYLKSLLNVLKVPQASQTLVFSKTSFQRDEISLRTPRAIYFNDDVYVGWVRGGEMIEIASSDPNLGTVFYTLDQHAKSPRLVREVAQCTQCHAGPVTGNVPGLLVRSVVTDPQGNPLLSAGGPITTQETPLADRWGGWYVTGEPGAASHLGNIVHQRSHDPTRAHGDRIPLDPQGYDRDLYLMPGSDPVALLVLAHQTEMHNRLTRANFLTRRALWDQQVLSEAGGEKDAKLSPSIRRRIKSACEPVVQYMLFSGEAKLEPIEQKTDFAASFSASGPKDKHGRSLRDLDLKNRMFKYPCSYLIYSDSFNALPPPAKEYIYERLLEVLIGEDISDAFSHLTKEDRLTILDILRDTKSDLPEKWKTATW